jgi:phosphomannomutase
VKKSKADLGIAVDPDVDRLCFVCEDGSMFGEEYTLVAVADYVLGQRPGNTVSNMSSTKALKEITMAHGGRIILRRSGEVNVVSAMKAVDAVIGGEGNGGIIVPDLHYGRDALIGIGLFLSALAHQKGASNRFGKNILIILSPRTRSSFGRGSMFRPCWRRSKRNIRIIPVNTDDGLKIEFDNDWVHLRSSNTEPIIRIYAESNFETTANNIALRLMQDIKEAIAQGGDCAVGGE